MDYAVVVYFDEESEQSISRMMENICDTGVNTYMLDVGIRPHISLACFEETNPEELSRWLQTYTGTIEPFDVRFCSLGVFPINPSVLFLAPVVEKDIIKLHKRFNEDIKELASNFISHYLPDNWVPHCTLALGLDQCELQKALDVAVSEFTPLSATVTQIGFVQCNPFKEIVTFDIKKQENL